MSARTTAAAGHDATIAVRGLTGQRGSREPSVRRCPELHSGARAWGLEGRALHRAAIARVYGLDPAGGCSGYLLRVVGSMGRDERKAEIVADDAAQGGPIEHTTLCASRSGPMPLAALLLEWLVSGAAGATR